MRKLMVIIPTVAALAALAYGLLLLFCATLANRLIFPAPAANYEKDDSIFFIGLPGGADFVAARVYPAKDAKYCIVYSHGNREDLGTIDPLMRIFQSIGYTVLAYDYVGYGLSSDSSPNPEKLRLAARAAFEFARDSLNFDVSNIVPVGYSLGSAAACHMAEAFPGVRALVLVGGFASIPYAILPFDPLPWELLGNARIIENLDGVPILIMHGTRDITVAPRNARINFKSAQSSPARLVWFEGYGHGGLFESAEYWREIKNVIEDKKGYEKSSCTTVR